MTIYLCEPDFDGILSAVYEAWTSGKGHENVKLELDGGRFWSWTGRFGSWSCLPSM